MLWIVAEPPSPHTLLTSEETSDQTYYPEEELMDGEETEIPSGTCSEGSNSLQPVEGPKTKASCISLSCTLQPCTAPGRFPEGPPPGDGCLGRGMSPHTGRVIQVALQ
ncbi:unnamed protein product [Lepidochelys kempii]